MAVQYQETERTVHSLSGINILAGLWLIISPFALGFSAIEVALWNTLIVGVAVTIMAIIRVTNPLQYEGVSWTNFALGLWLIVSPFILGFSAVTAALWNSIILGAIILALAASSARVSSDVREGRGRGYDRHRDRDRDRGRGFGREREREIRLDRDRGRETTLDQDRTYDRGRTFDGGRGPREYSS